MASPQRKPDSEASNIEAQDQRDSSSAAKGEPTLDQVGYHEGFRVTDPDKKDGFGKAFVHVLLATVILGGGLYLYFQKVQRDEEVHNLAAMARTEYLKDNYSQLIEAEKLLDEALELNSRHRYSIATKALINAYLWHDHGVADRRQAAEEYIRLAEDRTIHLQERYGARALLMGAGGDPTEAERMLVEDVINLGGSGPAIFGGLGLSQRLMGKRSDARASLQRAAEAERRTPRFNYWIAQMYFDGEEYGNAASFIERALDVNPQHLHTLVLRARAQIASNTNLEQAGTQLNEILEYSDREVPPRVRGLALIGVAEHHNAERRYDDAIAFANQALEISSELPDAYVIKGIAMVGAGQDGALAIMRQGLDMFEHMPRAYHQSALTLLAARQLDDAQEIMELWGERVTRNAAYHIAFGNLLLEGEKPEEATTHYERAIELNPRSAEAFFRLGQIVLADEELERSEQVAQAIEHFNDAVRVRERYPEVYEAMGWIYLEQQAYAQGLRQFVQAFNYYNAQNADREVLHQLRRDIGAKLNELRQRRMAQAWIQESRELVR